MAAAHPAGKMAVKIMDEAGVGHSFAPILHNPDEPPVTGGDD